MLGNHLLPCDAHFFEEYARPLIRKYPACLDLEGLPADSFMERDFSLAFERFRQDRSAQYEMHPKFGRYVWDIHDQWYQKWNVILSLEHAWNWTLHRLDTMLLEEDPYTVDSLIPYLDLLARKHHIHPHHQDLLKRICGYLLSWQKSNKMLSNAGTMRLNTIPFFPPSWFSEKEELKTHMEVGDRLASSYFARFVPPYRQKDAKIPERWDVVFLKGLTYDPTNEKFDVDPSLIASTIPLYGLTVHMDQRTGYSYVMMVMRKATLGNLENSLQQMIPVDYQKPQRLALSITKAIKDLHWEYIHGNVHPRNILFNFDDSIGELVDATFMQRKPPSSSVIPSPSTITHHHRHSHHLHHPYPTTTTATPAPTPPTSPQDDPASSSAHSPFCLPTSSHSLQPSHLASPYPTSVMPYHAHVNRKGGMSGRWPYVSPEVAQGITGPTTEADVYALGVILWQLISRLTFPANAPVDPWVFRIEPIPGILPEWEKLYKDCLQADPARRPSAYTVYRRLEKMPITYVTDTGATRLLPIHQHTIQYIQQRQKEIEDFLRIHENTFSQPEHRLTQLQNDVILTASITRSINHGLASYPSPVFLFRDDRSSQATSPPPPLP